MRVVEISYYRFDLVEFSRFDYARYLVANILT